MGVALVLEHAPYTGRCRSGKPLRDEHSEEDSIMAKRQTRLGGMCRRAIMIILLSIVSSAVAMASPASPLLPPHKPVARAPRAPSEDTPVFEGHRPSLVNVADAMSAPAAAGHAIYLPFVNGAASNSPPDGHERDSGALWLPYRDADGVVRHTYRSTVAVDARGGIHVAFAMYMGTDRDARPATYAFCAGGCDKIASWSFTHLGGFFYDVRLVLDPAGHPRLLLFGPIESTVSESPTRYQYAVCDAACASPSSWTLTTVAVMADPFHITREDNNNRYFALDPQGHPAFVYADWSRDHNGTFYIGCFTAPASGCTDANNWTEVNLAESHFDVPSLVFSRLGQPRVAFGLHQDLGDGSVYKLWYAQCDQVCVNADNWAYVSLTKAHGSMVQSLQVDASGSPRIAWFSGWEAYGPFTSYELYYLYCTTSCVDLQAGTWGYSHMALSRGPAGGVDLQLDGQDRPRVAYQELGGGLGYAWCNAGCTANGEQWRNQQIESEEALANDYDILPIRRCSISTWFGGVRPSLALDPQGNPRIGYDAQHYWYGTEIVNGVPRQCDYKDINVTRFALLPQP
jgi:hypothetical protein